MIGAFKFNGVESSSFNLICKSVKRPLLPAAKPKRLDPPNLSGVYNFPGLEYSTRELSMRIVYLGTSFSELRTRARDIAAWLSVREPNSWGELIINDEPDKYYLARVEDEIDLSTMFEAGEAEIKFECQPYAYSVDEIELVYENITHNEICDFQNPGTRIIDYRSPDEGSFIIELDGSWDAGITLNLNSRNLIHNQAVSNKLLRISNIDMWATLIEPGVGATNAYGDLDGDYDRFLHLVPGQNVLTIIGTNMNLDASIIFRPQWI
jgi:predicted phage tail component-like protein